MSAEIYFDKHGLYQLSGASINIQGIQGWAMVSIQIVSGSVTITGVVDIIGDKVTGAITFASGSPPITFGSGISAVDDLTIDATSGVVNIIAVKVKNPN